ncbi:MAG: ATP-binding protein [Acidobacteria bacterium]|nr:ATP-binding protein [Acidobacteriota bacterium]
MPEFDFGEPRQNGFNYSMSLVEKYQPRRIEDFIGPEGPKRLFQNLLKALRPVAVLLVGPPGCGKTTLGMAFADELPRTLHHLSSQKCDVAALDRLNALLTYHPSCGKFHVVLVDEADQMTEKAQLQLLSRLDGTVGLKPKFGGGCERGRALPVLWIFTCNGRGEDGTTPPSTFEPRFLSRCLVVPCGKPEVPDIAQFLRRIWSLEGGSGSDDPSPLADCCDGIRDALTRMEVTLCTGILPSRQVERKLASQTLGWRGKVRYLAPGQPDPDPREWQFRMVSKKGSRVYVRS